MKAESTELAGQKETAYHEEKVSKDRHWIFFLLFCCSSTGLVCCFRLHWFASGVKSLFRRSPQMETTTFDSLHIVLASVHSRLSLVTSPNKLTFKHELSAYFHLMSEGGHFRFRWFRTCAEYLRPPNFFLVIFNYCSYSPVRRWGI